MKDKKEGKMRRKT